MSIALLVAAAVSLVLAWMTAAVMLLLSRFVPRLTTLGRGSATVLRASLVLTPVLVAILALVAMLAPGSLSYCHCLEHGGHHPHLCIYHPRLALPLLAPSAAIAAVWFGQACWRACTVLRDLWRSERWATSLARLPCQAIDGVKVHLVDDLAFGAFTLGIWTPIVAVDRSLWAQLKPEERLAVVHHESAHLQRRDALTLACLRLASTFLPWRSNGSWLRGWRAASEAACDRHAAVQVKDSTCVAMALVAVERIRSRLRHSGPLAPALGIAAGSELQVRVHALLDDDSRSAPLANDLLAVGIALVGLCVLLLLLPGSSLHHVVESVLGLLVH
jgi:Zn-dependent protease with chaperone function